MKQQVDNATLEECRRNPALAAAQRPGFVVCLACGLLVRRLTRSPKCHARYVHNLDATAYLAKWPGAPLSSAEAVRAERKARKAYLSAPANRELIKKQRRARYKEICEIAESDPASPEAAWLKKQHDRSAAYWKNLYRGAGDGDKEAEAFRKSESDRRRKRHEANKKEENKRERLRYQRDLPTRRAKNREKARRIRDLAALAQAKGLTAEKKKRGRKKGHSEEQQKRIQLAGAFFKMDWSQRRMAAFIYKANISDYANTRNLFADHRGEIKAAAQAMTINAAESLLRQAGALP